MNGFCILHKNCLVNDQIISATCPYMERVHDPQASNASGAKLLKSTTEAWKHQIIILY
jgi:hypothetical protein